MTHPITSERRVSRRSLRARSNWLRFSRLYSLSAGVAIATILVFLSVGIIPCPKIASASHGTYGTCKDLMDAHPENYDFDAFNNTGGTDLFSEQYRKLCVMENERLQELKDNLIYAATGVDSSGTGFGGAAGFQITPEQMRQISLSGLGNARGLRPGFNSAGAGKPVSRIWAYLSSMLPDGSKGNGVRLDVEGESTGTGRFAYFDGAGNKLREGQITQYSFTRLDNAQYPNFRLGVKYTISNYSQTYDIAGVVGVRCLWTDGNYRNHIGYGLGRSQEGLFVYGSGSFINGETCRMYTRDVQEGETAERPDLQFGGTFTIDANTPNVTAVPKGYNPSNLHGAEGATVTPPQGDTVALPHETRILSDEIRANPEYQPRKTPEAYPPPPPGVDEKQWEQHQRRIRELTPPHGAPVGEPTVRVNEDGSLTTRFSDGTELTTYTDLTELIKNRDGTETWKYSDGVQRENNPNTGQETITYPDGTTVTNSPGARPVWMRPPSPGAEPQPIPAPNPEAYPPPPSGNYSPPPPTPGGPGGCPKPANVVFILPPLDFGEKFPFSLIISAKDGLNDLISPERAPQLELPLVGTIDLGQWAGPVGIMRSFLWFVIGVILMPIFFFTLIKGRE